MDETALRDLETWKDRIEVRLDNRQVFFLFFGSAMVACMLFVLGVIVGKRLESRGRALAPMVEDPLAALDRFGAERGGAVAAPSALTFPRALLGGGSASTSSSHAGKTEKSDRRVDDRRVEERKIEDKKIEQTAERVERAPQKTLAPSPARVAVAEPAPLPAAPPASAASQAGAEEGTTSNRRLAALPRPLGAPGTVPSRSALSGAREAAAPKTLASTVPPSSKPLAPVSSPKESGPPPPSAPSKVLSAAQAVKPVAPTGTRAASLPLAKAAASTPAPKNPIVAAAPAPVRAAAAAPPTKAPPVVSPNPKVTAASPAPHKGFLLQLSSFQDRSEADAFARRFSSENAYVVPTDVPGKGTVYRVRVGSYASLKEAAAAKTNFEQTHNVIAYVAGTGPAQ